MANGSNTACELDSPTGSAPTPHDSQSNGAAGVALTPAQAAHLLERTRREARRERIARHLAGDSSPSNFTAMVEVMVGREVFQGHEPCEHCHGLGFRPLPRSVQDQYDDREEHRLEEIRLLERQIREAEAPDEFEGASYKTKKLVAKLVDTRENQRDDRRERNRRSICRPCRGSGYGPRFLDGEGGKADSMWTTVTCPTCRGRDARNLRRAADGTRAYPGLMVTHYGSSTGSLRMRGPTRLHDPSDPEDVYTVVSDPRDDRAADRHDVCPDCLGPDGLGLGYRQPITVRPNAKGSQVQEDPHGVDDLPEHFPASDQALQLLDPHDPGDFLEQARRDDPLLAAAIAALHGRHGDDWSEHAWGRRFALFPLTDAGRQLADASHAEASHAGGYERALALCAAERLAATEATKPDLLRNALIRMADDQARLLERRAEDAIDEGSGA